jgi:hypothetical protein
MHHGRLYVARRWFRTTTAVVRPPARRSPCYRAARSHSVWSFVGEFASSGRALPQTCFSVDRVYSSAAATSDLLDPCAYLRPTDHAILIYRILMMCHALGFVQIRQTGVLYAIFQRRVYVFHACCRGCSTRDTSMVLTALGQNEHLGHSI